MFNDMQEFEQSDLPSPPLAIIEPDRLFMSVVVDEESEDKIRPGLVVSGKRLAKPSEGSEKLEDDKDRTPVVVLLSFASAAEVMATIQACLGILLPMDMAREYSNLLQEQIRALIGPEDAPYTDRPQTVFEERAQEARRLWEMSRSGRDIVAEAEAIFAEIRGESA